VSEGLLIYLRPEDVAMLATDLHAEPSPEKWLFDLASPALLRRLEKGWGRRVAEGGAPFLFAPPTGTKFFEPFGWVEEEFRSLWLEGRRLRRMPPLAWLWNLLGRLASPERREEIRRFSGVVLMRRR
jgi:O-methyltransferase involved in polyketide biosynthesis